MLIDATTKNLPPGYLPQRTINGLGLLLLPDKPIWIEVANVNNRITKKDFKFSISPDGNLQGSFSIEYHGYAKHLERESIDAKSSKSALETLANKFNIKKESITVENLGDTEKPLRLTANFSGKNLHADAGTDIIFPFLFFENTGSHPFQLEERAYPVFFGTPFAEQVRMEISIPQGWKFSHYPKSQNIRNRDGSVYSYQVEETGGKLIIITLITQPKAIIETRFYGFLKAFHHRIITLHNEKIIISPK